jgi:hypothetical protein
MSVSLVNFKNLTHDSLSWTTAKVNLSNLKVTDAIKTEPWIGVLRIKKYKNLKEE